jgi:hypothetical protein
MKKITLIVLTLIGTSLFSFGQTDTPATEGTQKENPKFRMGLTGAPVVSWYGVSENGDVVESDGARINIKYGLNMDFGLGENQNYYFSTGIGVINTGGTLKHKYFARSGESADYMLTTRTVDFRVNYINIPVTVMLRTQEIGYLNYFGRVGFDIGAAVRSNYDSEDVYQDMSGTTVTVESENASDDFTNLFRFGLHLEAGVEFQLAGNTNLALSLEYNNGLNNIFDKDYKLPVATDVNDDIGVSSNDNGTPEVDERVKATSNMILLNIGIYF